MKTTLVIPAKGTSERVLNKNLQRINGKSLVRMACEKGLACKSVDEVYIDTEDDRIWNDVADLSREGLRLIRRPRELASNYCTANDLIVYSLHCIEECDLILQTFSTSPLMTAETIDRCVDEFLVKADKTNCCCFFTVVPVQEYFWKDGKPANFDPAVLPNSFELETQYMETHGLYGALASEVLRKKSRVPGKPLLVEVSKLEALDIDDPDDLEMARRLLR
jgi:CMP-N-acetylneuraminic acid synthetase